MQETRVGCTLQSGKCGRNVPRNHSRLDHGQVMIRIGSFPSHGRVTPKSQSKSKSGHGRVTAFANHRRITVGSLTILYDRLLAVPSCLSCLSYLFTFLVISISTVRIFGTLSQNPPSHGRNNLTNHNITDLSVHLNRLILVLILLLSLIHPSKLPQVPFIRPRHRSFFPYLLSKERRAEEQTFPIDLKNLSTTCRPS